MATRTTIFANTIEQNRGVEFFQHRINQFTKIRSYHLFPMQKCAFGEHPFILYKKDLNKHSLNDLIQAKIQIHPLKIKSIIWQFTKLMLNCEEQKVNHFRLYPRSILLAEKYNPQNPIFIFIKDFSLGKEFETVKQGKVLQIFEYLHPRLSIENKMLDFDFYEPNLDIWSLGIILYKLVYFQSPFCKPGKDIFSKTILKEYLAGKYKIEYSKQEYKDINKFIEKCLSNDEQVQRFRSWETIKSFILSEEEMYNLLDFHDQNFQEMAKIHIKFMIFMSNIYCMIIDQCRQSPNIFWKRPISKQRKIPFQIMICEFTLALMVMVEERFYRLYSSHLALLKAITRVSLKDITQSLENELKFMQGKWIEPKFKSKTLDFQIIKQIQDICIKLKLQAFQENDNVEIIKRASEQFGSKRITLMRSSILKKKDSKNGKKPKKQRKVWKNIQILFDYCTQMLMIVSTTTKKQQMKYIFEEFYINSVFSSILVDEFHYSPDLSDVFKKVYKEYLQ